jgi:hypothetical protein
MRYRNCLLFAATLLVIAGCAQRSQLYQWQEYDRKLYSYYKDPTTSKTFLQQLETHVGVLETAGQVPPPGIYAEIGTLYLEGGDAKKAAVFYRKEAAAWPPSAPLMNTLITALEKPKQGGGK